MTAIICEKCGKDFKNEAGLRMHDMRVHTGQIKTPGQLGLVRRQPQAVGRGQKRGLGDDEEFQTVMSRLVTDYSDGGSIKWAQARREHPEWKRVFKMPESTLLYWGRTWKKKVTGSTSGTTSPSVANDQAIVERIVREYSPEGTISWKRAFEEHPEWKQALSHIKWTTLYSRGNNLKAKFAKQAKQQQQQAQPQALAVAPVRGRPRLQRVQLNGAMPEGGPPGSVLFCPHCGEHIAMWQKVAEVMKGL